jgi:CheY-like chemotaxis protein
VVNLFDGGTVRATKAAAGREALEVLRRQPADCVVVDQDLQDMTSEAFAAELAQDPALAEVPLIVYGKRETATNGDAGHAAHANGASGGGSFAKGTLPGAANVRHAGSLERLLDQATLALHCPLSQLPAARRQSLEDLHQTDKVLAGRKVLVVDDDIRNIFALTSVLEWHNMIVVPAETGREAIEALQAQSDIDIVLMDIMMPEMDGMDTMRAIRQMPQFKTLPIIAVTAKAMKGDREKCIEAGAWDYLSKPVDTEQMLAVLRGWLHR